MTNDGDATGGTFTLNSVEPAGLTWNRLGIVNNGANCILPTTGMVSAGTIIPCTNNGAVTIQDQQANVLAVTFMIGTTAQTARLTGFVTNDGDAAGGTFTINSVEPQDLTWARLEFGNNGATCMIPASGTVLAGTVLTCTSNGYVTIRDNQANVLAVSFTIGTSMTQTARLTGFVTNDGDGVGGTFTINSVEPADLDWGRLTYGTNAASCQMPTTSGAVTAGTVISCVGNGLVTIRDTQANAVAVTFTVGGSSAQSVRITGFVTNDGDGTGGTFTINSVEPSELDWSRLAYGNNGAGCSALPSSGPVTAGSYVTCTGNGSASIHDAQANAIVVSFTIG